MKTSRGRFDVGGRAVVVATLVALVAALVFLGREFLFEKVHEEIPRGYRGEAATNPLFALQELYRRFDVEVRGVSGIRHLPPAGEVLLLAAPQRHFGVVGVERLLRWVEEGGRLVVLPVGAPGEDPLLAALGVVRFNVSEADEDDEESRSEFASDRPPWPLLYAEEGREVVYADGAEDAAWILTIDLGEGTATVVTDGAFLENSALASFDHALIAWQLLHAGRTEPAAAVTEVWVVVRDPKPSVWAVLTSRSWPMAISLALLVVAALGTSSRRFGPLLEPEPREQRHLAEHIRALGRFLWFVRADDTLLCATREALGRRMSHGQSTAVVEGRARVLATTAGVDEGALQQALGSPGTRDVHRFTHLVQILETLRKST